MSARKTIGYLLATVWLLPQATLADTYLTVDTLAQQLGWVPSTDNNCGGYYLDPALAYPESNEKDSTLHITSDQAIFAQHGITILEGNVVATRFGQLITTNKADLYRDGSGKPIALDLFGNIHLREPNTLVVAKTGHYDLVSKIKSLRDIIYRTSFNQHQIIGPNIPAEEISKQRKITSMTAWGQAVEFSQTESRTYELTTASFSTCPPISPAWHVRSSHIVLNKNTGRGYATNARILVRNIPVFYTPYISFPLDSRRKSGFLWPTLGGSNKWGPYILAPYYWNMAPNYDMTITPGILTKRGIQLSDSFRYLTEVNSGKISISVLPADQLFTEYQRAIRENPTYANSTDPTTQAEFNRLMNDSNTRKSLYWRDDARFNEHWSSHIDFNYAGDDYYPRDFGSNLNEITQNQLLQEGDLYYKSQNWNFTGRLQAYQTMHPVDEAQVNNQYRRLPQLVLNADYPDQAGGFEYFINNEVTHFDIRNTPGFPQNMPIGNRLHMQPGISLPLSWTSFYVNPRVQLALTDYNLYQTAGTVTPTSKHRAVPIMDIASSISFSRDSSIFGYAYQQILEPQLYYTYIPYRNQSTIPNFDTTINTLTYDQIFNYNRFTGIDRIGDANQISAGVTTRFLDADSGIEKVRLGVGDIIYFSNRRVTLCNDQTVCTDNPQNPANKHRLSPVSGMLNYSVNPNWNLGANAIWDPISKQLGNSSINLHYKPDERRLINLGYLYAFNGNPLSGLSVNSPENNLKLTDFSFAWPVSADFSIMGRWSHDWSSDHFMNELYGLQYDTCCWAVRMVGGRAFTNLSSTGTPQYNSEFYIQFALKGLGNIGSGNPSGLLSSINGYNTQFGQEF